MSGKEKLIAHLAEIIARESVLVFFSVEDTGEIVMRVDGSKAAKAIIESAEARGDWSFQV
jgi:hypothetical protein